jgi:hypothetical protein
VKVGRGGQAVGDIAGAPPTEALYLVLGADDNSHSYRVLSQRATYCTGSQHTITIIRINSKSGKELFFWGG